MPYRIETDAHWREVLGTDGAEWAKAYIDTQQHREGDQQHHELTAWFDAAMATERNTIAAGLNRIRDDWPMRASDIGAFLQADRFAEFISIWTAEPPKQPDITMAELIALRLKQFIEDQGEEAARLPARQFVANRGDLIGATLWAALLEVSR